MNESPQSFFQIRIGLLQPECGDKVHFHFFRIRGGVLKMWNSEDWLGTAVFKAQSFEYFIIFGNRQIKKEDDVIIERKIAVAARVLEAKLVHDIRENIRLICFNNLKQLLA